MFGEPFAPTLVKFAWRIVFWVACCTRSTSPCLDLARRTSWALCHKLWATRGRRAIPRIWPGDTGRSVRRPRRRCGPGVAVAAHRVGAAVSLSPCRAPGRQGQGLRRLHHHSRWVYGLRKLRRRLRRRNPRCRRRHQPQEACRRGRRNSLRIGVQSGWIEGVRKPMRTHGLCVCVSIHVCMHYAQTLATGCRLLSSCTHGRDSVVCRC